MGSSRSRRAPSLNVSIRLALATALLTAGADAAERATVTNGPEPSVESAPSGSRESTQEETPNISTVVVVGSNHDARRDDTATKIVIDQTELLTFGDTTLAETLKRLPGITVTDGPTGRAGNVALRGLGSGYTQILLNGQKAPVGFTIESLTPEMVERVEIVRSATADLRTESIAGTINIILKTAVDATAREIKVGVGSARGRLAPSTSWQMSDKHGDLSYSLNASLGRREFLVTENETQAGSDATGQQNLLRFGTLRVTGRNDILSMTPAINLTLDNGDAVSLQGFFDANRHSKYGSVESVTELGTPQRHESNTQLTENDSVQARTDLSWTHEFESAAKLTTKLSLNANRQDGTFKQQGFAVDEVLNLDDTTLSEVREWGVVSTGKYSIPYFEDHSLQLGWDGSTTRRREDRVQYLRATSESSASDSFMDFDARVNRLGVFAQDEWAATRGWSLYYGARWEQIETRSYGNSFMGIRDRARIVSPLAQSLWKLPGTGRDQIRLALSRTYNTPPIASLIPRPFTSTNNTPLDPDFQGNPTLRPELALGLDLAYERFGRGGAVLSIGSYVRKIDDVIRSEVTLVGDRWVSSPVNGGEALTWGIEVDTKFGLKQFIDGAAAVDVRLNLTRNWSEVDAVPGPNNRIGQQTRLSSTLAADYPISARWTAGGSYAYKSGGPVRVSLHQIDDSSTRREVDLYALWSMSASSKLRLSLNNLLHQDTLNGSEYFDSFGTLSVGRARVSPITVRATLEVRF